jgi:hypothetical protein
VTTTTGYDSLSTHIDDTTFAVLAAPPGLTLTNLNAVTSGTYSWKQVSADVTAYAGMTIELYFKATTDVSNPTFFKIDDVSITWTRGPTTSPPARPSPVSRAAGSVRDILVPPATGSPAMLTAPGPAASTRLP